MKVRMRGHNGIPVELAVVPGSLIIEFDNGVEYQVRESRDVPGRLDIHADARIVLVPLASNFVSVGQLPNPVERPD